MTAGFNTRRFLRCLMLTVIFGCCVLVSLPEPGLAQNAPESGAAVDPVGSPGVEPVPGVTAASSSTSQASDDPPADVRLVFGFTAGTVLVLSALAFLDRRPEP